MFSPYYSGWDIYPHIRGLICASTKDLQEGVPEEELPLRSDDNVLIETLPTGRIGLPTVAAPLIRVPLDSWIEHEHIRQYISAGHS